MHIYRYGQLHIIILHQPVSITPVTFIRLSCTKDAINIIIIIQKRMTKTAWHYTWVLCNVPNGRKMLKHEKVKR
jgi:hypothetical protein